MRTAGYVGLLLLSGALFGAAPATAEETAAGGTNVLERQRAKFDAEAGKLAAAREEKATALGDKYVKSLAALEKAAQESGQLEPVLAVRKEHARYDAEHGPGDPEAASGVAELDAQRSDYANEAHAVEVEYAGKVITLAGQYDEFLATLQEKYTRQGSYDAALKVKDERTGIEALPAVSAARFTLADAEARQKAAERAPQAEAGAPPPAAAPALKKDKPPVLIGNADAYLRKRFARLREAILGEKWEQTTDMVDPDYVRQKGADLVKLQMQFLFPFLKAARNLGVELEPGSVELLDGGTRARVETRSWLNNRWEAGRSTFWVKRDDDWYVDIGPQQEERAREREDRRAERQEPARDGKAASPRPAPRRPAP